MRITTADEALAVLTPYQGQKAAVFRELGDQFASDVLHKAFAGNAKASADYLGFRTNDSILQRWRKSGLIPCGRDNPRRDYAAEAAARRDCTYPRDARFSPPPGVQTASHEPLRPDPDDGNSYTDEQWFALYESICEAQEWSVRCEWELPSGTEFGLLHFIGDTQLGNTALDVRRIKDFVDWLADRPHDRWVGLGDWFEQRTRLSKGEQPVMPEDVTMRYAIRLFEPIMDRCLVMHTGNHDQRLQVQTDARFDPCAAFANHFGVPFCGIDGFHTVRLWSRDGAEQTYTGYCHHGTGAAATPGGRANNLIRHGQNTVSDYTACGHLHGKEHQPVGTFGPDETGEIDARFKPAVRCGSWLRHKAGSYARTKGLAPGVPGAATLYLHLDKHDVHARM